MQVVELKPSNNIIFKIPNNLVVKFTIGNLTLRTVCVYIVSLHPHVFSISPPCTLIDAFQQTQINITLHWSQAISSYFKSKLRVYIWELYDDQSLNTVVSKMFNKETDGNCLQFDQLTVQVAIDNNYLQQTKKVYSPVYSINRILLPNMSAVVLTQQMIHKVLSHCEKVAKVKAIYTFDTQYIVQFQNLDDVVASFCQVRDASERLALFAISCLSTLGNPIYTPDILIFNKINIEAKSNKKQVSKLSFASKQTQQKKSQPKFKQEQVQKTDLVQFQKQKQDNKQLDHNFNKNKHQKHHHVSLAQQQKIGINSHKLREGQKGKGKDLVKQSFMVLPYSQKNPLRKRSKSQQFNFDKNDDCDYSSTSIDIEVLNQWRTGRNFQIKTKKQFKQNIIDVSKKILNMQVSSDQKYLYLLLRDCVIVYQIQNLSNKRVIKFDSIDSQNTNLPTPMVLFNKQRTLIFGNESYLFWVSLVGEQPPDWKYVQRKEIYSLQVIQELNLLMVGGKNFSKLSYLGKSTSRSNIKVYSCGKLGKRDHLYTYDIPNCNGENVISMKYIMTKPNGTKLLLVVTSNSKFYFLRVRAFNNIQVYSVMESQQIGIQQIISINYHIVSNILVCLQKLSEEAYCFKYIKVNCSYEKIQLSTQSVKLPVVKYASIFRLGGKAGNEWLTAVDFNNNIYTLYLDWKQPEKVSYNSLIKECIILQNGAVFRQTTQIRFRVLKQ